MIVDLGRPPRRPQPLGIAELKSSALAHLPSGMFAANGVWLTLVQDGGGGHGSAYGAGREVRRHISAATPPPPECRVGCAPSWSGSAACTGTPVRLPDPVSCTSRPMRSPCRPKLIFRWSGSVVGVPDRPVCPACPLVSGRARTGRRSGGGGQWVVGAHRRTAGASQAHGVVRGAKSCRMVRIAPPEVARTYTVVAGRGHESCPLLSWQSRGQGVRTPVVPTEVSGGVSDHGALVDSSR